MAHERVGDRADHPHRPGAEMRVQHIFEKDHMRAAVRQGLVVHAVIGGHRDNAAERLQPRQPLVERRMKFERLLFVGGVAVLHVIGQREVQKFGAFLVRQA